MRSDTLQFVLRLVVYSLVLYGLWVGWGENAYARIFGHIARGIYGALGMRITEMREAVNIVVDHFYNLIPFLSLILATGGISMKRRLAGGAVGLFVLMSWHLVFIAITHEIFGSHQLDVTAYKHLSPWFLLSDALPFLLWIAVAPKSIASAFAKEPGNKTTDKGSRKKSRKSYKRAKAR